MTAVAKIAPASPVAVARGADMLTDTSQFELAQRWANAFANSQLVPAHLRGKTADCLIGLMMAKELGDNPLMVLQNIYVVSGKAGWSANYMIARANRSGVFKGRITWETTGTGKDMVVRARAMLADTLETVSAVASMQMAVAEGWAKNAKYQTMPEHMLRYRSATMLIRLYCPEVMLGMQTAEELETDALSQPAPTVAASLDAFAEDVAAEPAALAIAADEPPAEPPAAAFDFSSYIADCEADLAKIGDKDALAEMDASVTQTLADQGADEDTKRYWRRIVLERQQALSKPRR